MKKYIIFPMLALVLLTGCKAFEDETKETQVNHLGLFDFSLSVDSASYNSYIREYIATCFANLSIYDASINFPIDGTPEVKSKSIYYTDFSQRNFLTNTHIVTHAADSIKSSFEKYKQQQRGTIFSAFQNSKKSRGGSIGNTDIITSLLLLAKYINRDTTQASAINNLKNISLGNKTFKTVNFITIFSDMINDDANRSAFTMNDFAFVSHKKIDALLDQLQTGNKIANLRNCFVVVNGATGEGRNPSLQYENIQYFWTEYFKKSGAVLLGYGYDSSLDISAFFKKYRG